MDSKAPSTIYDVADKVGVSISTISRYLNSPEKVNTGTAERIKTAMDELGYIPQGNTGSRQQRQIGRIGVLSPFFPAPSFMSRLQGVSAALHQSRYEMIVYAVDSPEQLDEYLHSVPFTKRLDGLIVMSMRISHEAAGRLLKTGLPVVGIEYHNEAFDCIEADNVRGGELAAMHLLELGYARCGFIGEANMQAFSLQPSQSRFEGFSRALAEAGHPIADVHVRLGDFDVEDARALAGELLDLSDRPRSIFAMSDLQAIGALKAARDRKLRVPEDVAILGFDDIEAAGYIDLSTVSQSLRDSGLLAGRLVMERIAEPGRPIKTVRLEVKIVRRSTT
ncbi:MAG: LacI family DNA-binding transcriptional regulator [Spirochaetes bacterium]|nr:LacI family DNA-binding transcriptional regulator [Spirochaetota bacterium]